MKGSNVHLLWTIAVLVAIISVVLWTLPNGEFLSGYIAFAASIASLVLAVVAIFQSILSSKGLEQSLGEIRHSTKAIVEETSRLGKASITLSAEADAALRRLSVLPDEITDMRGELSDRIERLNFHLPASKDPDVNEEVPDILENRTMGFVLAIYCVALAKKSKKYIRLNDIFDRATFAAVNSYVAGVLFCIKEFDICGIKIEGVDSTYSVLSLGQIKPDEVIKSVEGATSLEKSIKLARESAKTFFALSSSVDQSGVDEEEPGEVGSDD